MRFIQVASYFILLSLTALPLTAQPNGAERLAMQYFEQREFEKANHYLEDLYDENPEAWFSTYYKSLLGAKDLARAEKITKRQLKNSRNEVSLHVLLARIYRLQGDEKKAREASEKAIRELTPVQPFIQNLALTFQEDRQYEFALRVYEKARKSGGDYPYYYERAEIFKAMNDIPSMVNEYLDALEFRESELLTVRTQLQNSLGYDDESGGMKNPLLRQELQKRILKNPDKVVLVELLIFIQQQQRDFAGAFVQSRSLDKRLKEDGLRIYELAQVCVSNEDWETARRCYEYLAEKGPKSNYYDIARIEGLHAEFLALTQGRQPTNEELLQLEAKLEKTVEEYGDSYLGSNMLKDLANLKAYYLNKTDGAITLLEGVLRKPGMDAAGRAGYKLMLADVYLVRGEIWEASLLYSQVEKDFKYEAIGQEAKYRNARLSYYAGDFQWAKAQADVLKGATSKLIANDALDLSLVISDAIGVDTNDLPLRLFSSAELMVLQHRYLEAIARMDSINLLFASHTLTDDIYFRKAAIYKSMGRYADTEAMYRNIIEYFPGELYGDDAQFRLAELYEIQLNDPVKAGEAYQEVLVKYPGSIFTVEARKRYRNLRGDSLNN
jgi:tetratricopeptide (TPR) repeat protein